MDLGIQFAIAIVGWQGLEQAFMQMIALTNNLWREDYEKSIEKILVITFEFDSITNTGIDKKGIIFFKLINLKFNLEYLNR